MVLLGICAGLDNYLVYLPDRSPAQEVIIYWPPLGEPLVDELRTDAMITKDDLI